MLGGDGMSILDNQSVIDDERSAALGYTHSMVGSKAGSGEDSVFMSDLMLGCSWSGQLALNVKCCSKITDDINFTP